MAPTAGFKNCCLTSGKFDGSDRDYFFQGVGRRVELSAAAATSELTGSQPLPLATPAFVAGRASASSRFSLLRWSYLSTAIDNSQAVLISAVFSISYHFT